MNNNFIFNILYYTFKKIKIGYPQISSEAIDNLLGFNYTISVYA